MVSLLASSVLLFQPAARNLAFKQAFAAAIYDPADYYQAMTKLAPIITQDCRINWQISLLALRADIPPDIEINMQNMLDCSPKSVDWLILIAPQRTDLALRAAKLYPEEAQIWLWLGDLAKTAEDPTLADKYFTESTRLDPYYGLAWCRLGRIKESQELLDEALYAFWECCQNGDPGSNGCYGAGRIAENLGDIPSAIQYYRRSHWQPALARADELESSR